MRFLLAFALAATLCPTLAIAEPLRPVWVARFAHFLDLESLRRTGDVATFRYLMVTPDDFEADGEAFWGGWSYMTLNCVVRTADLTGFQSVRAGGRAGPITADTRPGWPIAAGSLEAALAEAACDGRRPLDGADAANVEDAVTLGRTLLQAE